MNVRRIARVLAMAGLCAGWAGVSAAGPIELSWTSSYAPMLDEFNGNRWSDEIFQSKGSTCCVNNGWVPEPVATDLFLFNGATEGEVVSKTNPTGFKTLLATTIDVHAGETYAIDAVGKSMQYAYAADNKAPILSLLFGLEQSDGSMTWWESGHATTQEATYSHLASLFAAISDAKLYMLFVDMNALFETNDGIAGIRVQRISDVQAVPTPEPTSLALVLGGGLAYLAKRRRQATA